VREEQRREDGREERSPSKKDKKTLQEWKGCLPYREGYRREQTLSSPQDSMKDLSSRDRGIFHERQDNSSSQGRGRVQGEYRRVFTRKRKVQENPHKQIETLFLQEAVSTDPSREGSWRKKMQQNPRES